MAALVMSCGGRTSEDPVPNEGSRQSPAAKACSPRHGSGDIETDCQKYCSAYIDCAGCPEATRLTCESRCFGHGSQRECLTCAVDHIHEVSNALRCDDQQNFFTLTFPDSTCGAVCGSP
jgi:hypothetical protein